MDPELHPDVSALPALLGTMAQPTGLAEIYEGAVVSNDGTVVIDGRSVAIGATTSAKEVTITERTFSVTGDCAV